MGGFLAANAFLLGIILIGAGLLFALGTLVKTLGLAPDSEIYAWIAAIVASVVGTYYVGKWFHGLIERHLMGKSRRR